MERGDDTECGCRPLETDGSGASNPGEPLELDTLLESLEHPRRRYLLYALSERSSLTLSELAAMIASWEAGIPPEDVDERDRDRAFIALYHAHVPKLEREGVVDFDGVTEVVTLGPNGPQVLNALDAIGGSRDTSLEEHARDTIDD